MKLPQNKKKRQQLFMLIALAVGGLLYALWALVYQPVRNQRDEAEQRIEQLEIDIRRAQQRVRDGADVEHQLRTLSAELEALSERHMLHPRLGNYMLEAREMVRRHADASGVRHWQAEEIGLTPLPRVRGDAAQQHPVQGYALRITAECGYDALREWIGRLEEDNPLFNLYSLMITVHSGRPLTHQVQFDVQWPVWVNPAQRQSVRERAEAATVGGEP